MRHMLLAFTLVAFTSVSAEADVWDLSKLAKEAHKSIKSVGQKKVDPEGSSGLTNADVEKMVELIEEQNRVIEKATGTVRDAREMVNTANTRVLDITVILEQEVEEDRLQLAEMERIKTDLAKTEQLQAQTLSQLQNAENSVYYTQAQMEKMRRRGWIPAPISTVLWIFGAYD